MKAVLGLALLCCFVVGSLGNQCEYSAEECENFKDCACKNPLVIKATIKKFVDDDFEMDDKPAVQELWKLKTREVFKPADSKNNIGFLVVPRGCGWHFHVGETYYLFCHEISIKIKGRPGKKRACKIGKPRGFKKLKNNATWEQEKFLRQVREGKECV